MTDFTHLDRSRVGAPRRRGRRRQRRVLRREGQPRQAGHAGLARGQVHRPRQVDGRLGDAPPPRARPRLVHRPARASRHRARGSASTRRTSRATTPDRARSMSAIAAAPDPGPDEQPGRSCCPARRSRRDSENLFEVPQSAALDAPPPEHLSRRRRRAVPRGGRGRFPTGSRSPAGAERSISRRSRTAASSSPRATCSSGRATT